MKHIDEHYRAHHDNYVIFLAKRLGWHGAEDAVQAAYVRAIEACHTEERLNSWFPTILRKAASRVTEVQKGRDKKHYNFSEYTTCFDNLADSPEDEELSKCTIDKVSKLIAKFTHRSHREVLEGIFIKDLTYAEAAEIFDMNPATMRKVVYQFREMLRNR